MVAVVLVGGGIAFAFTRGTKGETRYVLATVARGSVITTVSGTGQVSTSNQVDVKPKVSGDVTAVMVKAGQTVRAGVALAYIDARDAQKAVRDAQVNLQSAQLSLDKLQKPTDALTLTQAQNSLARAQESKQTASDDLQKSYDDGYNTVSNVFLELPGIMTGLDDLLFGTNSSIMSGQWNLDYYSGAAAQFDDRSDVYKKDAYDKYQTARKAYDQNFIDYKSASRFSDSATVESLITESYATSKSIAEAVKSLNNLIQFYKDTLTLHSVRPTAVADTHLTTLSGYTSKTNTHVSNLLNITNSIQSDKDTITNATRTIDEATQSLAKLQAGTDALDLASAQLTLKQRQNALYDAQEKLADYSIRAPFDGTVAVVTVKKADAVSSGTAAFTMITQQKLAELSLNEVDVAKVKVGQKATLTFDAVEGLSITGEVAEVDSIGAVSQGVVSYKVKINFDTQDDRVKSGMSVSANIITEMRQDVLIVPNGAIKGQVGNYYIETITNPSAEVVGVQGVTSVAAPNRTTIEIGLADDTSTEVMSGLKEGDAIIARTITATTKATTQTAPSLFGNSTRGVGTGGAVRTTTGR